MNIAILLGGGNGKRFGSDKIKEYLGDISVAEYSLRTFSVCKKIEKIILVSSAKNHIFLQNIAMQYPKVSSVVRGEKNRVQSAINGFYQIEGDTCDTVIFHNLVNPFLTQEDILFGIYYAKKYGAAGAAHRVTSTLRYDNGAHIPREKIWAMETPQALQYSVFQKGKDIFQTKKIPSETLTDDLHIAELAGVSPYIFPASTYNKKITFPEDLHFFRELLSQKNYFSLPQKTQKIATGIGQDSHIFSDAGILVLGGINITTAPKLLANSDGDAVLHALMNAISSAIGGGSLSTFADEMCRHGITNSAKYVDVLLKKLAEKNAKLLHCSVSIEAKKPKLERHFDCMRKRLSEIFSLPKTAIGITATTGEGMSDFGRGKGIRVWASATISFEKK